MTRLQNVSFIDLDMVGLKINNIYQTVNNKKERLNYQIDTPHQILGDRLRIFINPQEYQVLEDQLKLSIDYITLNNAEQRSINWLEPSQTAGKVLPYLFTQCESINCRSLVPLQDTPSNKITYNATITVDSVFNVQMSAHLESIH